MGPVSMEENGNRRRHSIWNNNSIWRGFFFGGLRIGALALQVASFPAAVVASILYNATPTEPRSSAHGIETGSQYLEWLELAIEEASKWRPSVPQPRPLASPREVAALEKVLLKQGDEII